MKAIIITVWLGSLAIATSAIAQQEPRLGFYAGLGLNLADEAFDKFGSDKDFDTGVGFQLNLGYRFHPNIALEGTCEFLKHIDSNDFAPDLNTSILAFSGNFKGYLATQRVQPFVLIGAGISRFQFKQGGSKDTDVGVTGRFGGGLDYYVVPQVSIGMTVAYVVTSGKIKDLNHTTVGMGAQYRF